MNRNHTLPLTLAGAALVAGAVALAATADLDPIVAYRQKMFATMPVGEREPKNTTGEEKFSPVKGAAQNHFDVPYLGADRDKLYRVSLDPRDRRARDGHPYCLEWRTRCNIHVPPGDGPFPVMIGIHGGSYSGGSKESGQLWAKGLPETCMERGIVWVKINYILGDGIHPQVQRDTKELIRFLRANAAAYKINPHRIALIGASAGGWLAGSSAFTTADDGWLPSASWRYKTAGLDGRDLKPAGQLVLPGDTVTPAHPEYSARVNAVIADFVDGLENGSPDDPQFLGFTDPGKPGFNAVRQANGHLMTIVTLSKPGVHLPSVDQLVASADGTKQIPLSERLQEFITVALLGPETISPAPEARPNQRWFADKIEVRLVGSGPGMAIYYTTDGSEPTVQSARYDKPFTLTASTTIKSLAVVPGMKPSGVMTAKFFKGPPPPVITGPAGVMLPPARVGEPYEVKFTAPGAGRWFVMMQTAVAQAPGVPQDKRGLEEYVRQSGQGGRNGLPFVAAGETCVIRGTPLMPGWTTVLVAAAHPAGQGCPVAGDRLYMLRIDPPADGSIPKRP